MKRLSRWLAGLALVLLLFAAGGLALYVWFFPGYVERRIVGAMREAGLPAPTARVRAVSTRYLQLTDVTVGERQALRIASVGITYDIDGLRRGNVDTVEVAGAEYHVGFRDGKLDMGPLMEWAKAQPARTGPLPFRQVRLLSSSLIIHWRGAAIRLPFEGTIGDKGIDLQAYLPGMAASVRGDAAGEAWLAELGSDIDIAQPLRLKGKFENGQLSAALMFRDKTLATLATVPATGGLTADLPLAEQTRATLSTGPVSGEINAALTSQGQTIATLHRGEATKLTWEVHGPPPQRMRQWLSARGWTVQEARFAGAMTLADGGVRLENIELALQRASMVQGPMTAANVTATLRLTGLVTPSRVELRLQPGSAIMMDSLASPPQWSLGAASIALQPIGEQPLFSWSADTGVQWSVLVATAQPIAFKLPGAKLALGEVSASIPITSQKQSQAPSPESSRGESPGTPVPGNSSGGGTSGGWRIDKIELDGRTLPAIAGAIAISDSHLNFTAAWPFLDVARLNVNGDIDTDMNGTVHMAVDRFTVTDASKWNSLIGDALKDVDITGDFQLEGQIELNRGVPKPHITVQAFDVKVDNKAKSMVAQGMTGAITLESFTPLATAPTQGVHVERLSMGKLVLLDGHLTFRVESPSSLVIEGTDWHFEQGGRFWTHNFRVNPVAVAFDAQLFAENLPVMEWAKLVTDQRITGEGRLFGRLPINYDGTRETPLRLGEGYLYSNPGIGWFQVQNAQVIESLLDQSSMDFTARPELRTLKKNLVEALTNFEYSVLQMDFIEENGGVLTRVGISGHGRTGEKQEIGRLNFNVRGIEQALNTSLKWSNQDAIGEAVKHLLDQPQTPKEKPK